MEIKDNFLHNELEIELEIEFIKVIVSGFSKVPFKI